MIGKFIVKMMTKFALKRNDTDRLSEPYEKAKHIGIVYTFSNDQQRHEVMKLVEKIVADGKSVQTLTFIPKSKKIEEFSLPSFTESDFSSKGKWKSEGVIDFRATVFDYLISTDQEINKYIRNILASSKAKCRVGSYSEAHEAYFELMINHSDNSDFAEFLHQIYHYIIQMKNG